MLTLVRVLAVAGINAALVIAFLRSERGLQLQGLFWDFASVPQKDEHGNRTAAESEMFGRGLKSPTHDRTLTLASSGPAVSEYHALVPSLRTSCDLSTG